MAGTEARYDQEVTLAANGFTREGYTFRGWATSAAGEAVYAPGASVANLTAMANGVVMLYAVWAKEEAPAPEPEPEPSHEPPVWEVVLKDNTFVVYATVYDRALGAAVEAEGSLLAAFSAAGECRGVTEVIDGVKGRLFLLTVGVEGAVEEGIVLKVWNSATGVLTEIPSVSLTGKPNQNVGELIAPVTYTIGAVTQEIGLEPGWNWISTYLTLDAPTIGEAFAAQPFSDGDQILSALSRATYSGGKWEPESFALNPGEAYAIYCAASEGLTLVLKGEPMAEAVAVEAGWNWVGLPQAAEATVSALAHSGGFADGDLIKSATGSTTYHDGQWYPGDFALKPGEGYLAKLANGGTLTVRESAESAVRSAEAVAAAEQE